MHDNIGIHSFPGWRKHGRHMADGGRAKPASSGFGSGPPAGCYPEGEGNAEAFDTQKLRPARRADQLQSADTRQTPPALEGAHSPCLRTVHHECKTLMASMLTRCVLIAVQLDAAPARAETVSGALQAVIPKGYASQGIWMGFGMSVSGSRGVPQLQQTTINMKVQCLPTTVSPRCRTRPMKEHTCISRMWLWPVSRAPPVLLKIFTSAHTKKRRAKRCGSQKC